MSKNHINEIRELVSPNDLIDLVDSSLYPKPRWMVNDSVYDKKWKMSKVGFDFPTNKENTRICSQLSFKRLIASGEYLTDKINQILLTDIQNSLLYLDVIGRITRPKRITEILITATKLILHANELRHADSKPPIRSLELIKFDDIKDYLLSYNVDRKTFDSTLECINERWESKANIDWDLLKYESGLTTRKFASLKHKLIICLKEHGEIFNKASHYKCEYPNASDRKFDIDNDLYPNEKTISNEISKLEAFYISRSAQKYKFQHSAQSLFSGGKAIFDDIKMSEKTLTMPVNVALHGLSTALNFARVYGPELRKYIAALSKSERDRINELNISNSTARQRIADIKKYAFENTQIPDELKFLNIKSWEGETFEEIEHSELRKCMSVGAAILLYIASIWILLASFSAGRLTSLLTLKRSCFQQSPVDGLFDIVMRIPKNSERFELEDVHRPIPDLIYDYGLEFASLVCELEDRQGFIADENELFLFGKILSLHSYDAFTLPEENEDPIYQYPLSGDTIKKTICFFQDWSESPLIDGKRWYPSNHQFRKLFAVLYFNFSDDIGLEELAWFMGHSSLDEAFHYAEVDPSDEWIEEAESAIARTGAILDKTINGDEVVNNIIAEARTKTSISLILESLIRTMIDEHKTKTGQEVRFYKIEEEDVFFYFCKPEEE